MSFDIVCFDCDSTLSKIEGIDELGRRYGLGGQLAELTNAAMNGDVPLEAVYGQRLALIQPDRTSLDWLAELYLAEQVDGAATVFAELKAQGIETHIISGGLRPAILPLARLLGVTESNVHAVDMYFGSDGQYLGYEQTSALARSGGKAEICAKLRQPGTALAMVGDGKTDMEAKQAGAFTIGFGGVVIREAVRQSADVYIEDANLLAVLPHLLKNL